MYRIQAYNYVEKYHKIIQCKAHERDAIVQSLLDTGEYVRAGISCEWMPRID